MMSKEKKVPRCHWCPADAEGIDYREVDTITSKIYTCSTCRGLSTDVLIRRKQRAPEDEHWLYKKMEFYNFCYNYVMYEVHVDATEQRVIEQVFAEYGEVTPKIMAHLEEVVSKIDNT